MLQHDFSDNLRIKQIRSRLNKDAARVSMVLLGGACWHETIPGEILTLGTKKRLKVCLSGKRCGQYEDLHTKQQGDMFDLVSREVGGSHDNAVRWAREFFNCELEISNLKKANKLFQRMDEISRISDAYKFYQRAKFIPGSSTEKKLALAFGMHAPFPDLLKFRALRDQKSGDRIQAILAPMYFAHSQAFVGVAEKLDTELATKRDDFGFYGATPLDEGVPVIKLSSEYNFGEHLSIVSGFDAGLHLSSHAKGPIWIVEGSSWFRYFPILDHVSSLTIYLNASQSICHSKVSQYLTGHRYADYATVADGLSESANSALALQRKYAAAGKPCTVKSIDEVHSGEC